MLDFYASMGGTYGRLNAHVNESNLAVLRKFRKKLRKRFLRDHSPEARALRHAYYRAILKHHKEAGELFRLYRF